MRRFGYFWFISASENYWATVIYPFIFIPIRFIHFHGKMVFTALKTRCDNLRIYFGSFYCLIPPWMRHRTIRTIWTKTSYIPRTHLLKFTTEFTFTFSKFNPTIKVWTAKLDFLVITMFVLAKIISTVFIELAIWHLWWYYLVSIVAFIVTITPIHQEMFAYFKFTGVIILELFKCRLFLLNIFI